MLGTRKWRDGLVRELNEGSEVAETARGPMEYRAEGAAPFVLCVHGGPGGYDQGKLVAEAVFADFGTIAVSRPGYLRTPLATGRTFEEQADALAALLDALGIDRVAVYGASAGGPPSIHFAGRHPDRIVALLLTCAVTTVYPVYVPAWARAIIFSDTGSRLQTWLFERFPPGDAEDAPRPVEHVRRGGEGGGSGPHPERPGALRVRARTPAQPRAVRRPPGRVGERP